MTMIKITAYSLAAMLGLFSSTLSAEGGAYQIELIVLLQAMPNTEVFEQTASQIEWPSGLTELSAYKKPDTTTLDDSYAALSKDSAFQPILHVAWIQPVGEGGISAPVHIQSTDGTLNGYVQMQHEQSLHMMVDLELNSNPGDGSAKASAPADAPYLRPVGKIVVYRLNEKRVIKLNEVYYLDHPKFGVVIRISPL